MILCKNFKDHKFLDSLESKHLSEDHLDRIKLNYLNTIHKLERKYRALKITKWLLKIGELACMGVFSALIPWVLKNVFGNREPYISLGIYSGTLSTGVITVSTLIDRIVMFDERIHACNQTIIRLKKEGYNLIANGRRYHGLEGDKLVSAFLKKILRIVNFAVLEQKNPASLEFGNKHRSFRSVAKSFIGIDLDVLDDADFYYTEELK